VAWRSMRGAVCQRGRPGRREETTRTKCVFIERILQVGRFWVEVRFIFDFFSVKNAENEKSENEKMK